MSMDKQLSHGYPGRLASNAHPDHDACGTGFIAHLSGSAKHEVVDRALVALQRLSHRGGVDADGASGDGAGLLTATPLRFFRRQAHGLGIDLPQSFAVGMLFLPLNHQEHLQRKIESLAPLMGVTVLGWRKVPTNLSVPGERARETMPEVWQCFVQQESEIGDFERKLFLFRKKVEAELGPAAYFCSLSSRTIVYKGLLAPWQLPLFYPDLWEHDFESPYAIFHQRFSTNTQPTWRLAQPFRMVAHNGEINTISGNRRWMHAREPQIRAVLGVDTWFSALEANVSDSASLDNAVELLVHQGNNARDALNTLVPAAGMRETEYEPWDGPAALIFTDGCTLGAKLDRNGLRPLRYSRTSDGWFIAGSEAGIAKFDPEQIIERQRLGPGEMLTVDLANGEVVHQRAQPADSPAAKSASVSLPPIATEKTGNMEDLQRLAAAVGFSQDQIKFLLQPVAEGNDAIWSMGDDAPPAFLGRISRTLWDYCKQRFAQVTNPPIDPIREAHVMSLETRLGPGLLVPSPVLDSAQFQQLKDTLLPCCSIDITFVHTEGVAGAQATLNRLRTQAREAQKPALVILTDRELGPDRAAIPALLAASAVWQELAAAGNFDVPLVIETAQALDVHHIAMLLAVGVTAVRPYRAMQIAETISTRGAHNFVSGTNKGLRKVLARMGISTLASYRNAQLLEVIGLDGKLCREFFAAAPHYAEATSLEQLLAIYLGHHAEAFRAEEHEPRDAGLYRFRKEGELHSNSPDVVRRMHALVRGPSPERYREYEDLAAARNTAIRDLLEIVFPEAATAEPASEQDILRRFSVQAMSIGAISPEAHRTLAIAMNRLGARSNTGEGGEDPDLYHAQPEAASKVKQVASGRFGVTAEYLVHGQEIEIKMAQGSKPGEGGQLPATKVTPYIARLRRASVGTPLISPPPHHDIYSIEDLEQLIHDLRQVNPHARMGVKLVSGAGVGIIAAGVAKAGADVITICGHDGGTGASPLSSIKNTGLPWEFGLSETHRTLVEAGLRGHVRLRVDGGFKFARDVIIAALLGADEFGFGTAALLAIGCVMARQCHLNTCPVGIATQQEALRTRFNGKPEMVMVFFEMIAEEVRRMLAQLGAASLDEIVGHSEYLHPRNPDAAAWVHELLRPARRAPMLPRPARHREGLSAELSEFFRIRKGTFQTRFTIANSDRSIGAELSGELLRRAKAGGYFAPIDLHFSGAAGQSFGAFLAPGIRFHLSGEANDYVGKGLSGGIISIDAGPEACTRGDVLAGNTVLYGATSGELYIAGRAGERFAVRNSGAVAVVEGTGDHACEYMTGGIALLLGKTGVNLGAGMTGGLAYMLEEHAQESRFNLEFVSRSACSAAEESHIRELLVRHSLLTASPRANFLLNITTPLPLVRIQALNALTSPDEVWGPILERLHARDVLTTKPVARAHGLLPPLEVAEPESRDSHPDRVN